MANQTIGTPRFFIDYTQLAKQKGFLRNRASWDSSNSQGLNLNLDDKNMNVWNFDYANPTRYYTTDSNPANNIKYRLAFWNPSPQTDSDGNPVSAHNNAKLNWAKLISTTNWAGIINHNLNSAFPADSGFNLSFNLRLWNQGWAMNGTQSSHSQVLDRSEGINNGGEGYDPMDRDGYSIFTSNNGFPNEQLFTTSGAMIDLYSSVYLQIWIDTYNAGTSFSDGAPFDIGAFGFGKYIDMPHSPDLKVTKSIEYDGIKIQRSLGGGDFVQINNSGSPDWLAGEPWTLSTQKTTVTAINPERVVRIGKNGRRSWDLSFSYLSNDDLFYDYSEINTSGTTSVDVAGDQYLFESTSEIQQLWDLSLGGALSFVFTPDKDANKPEFAVCRLDQDSFVATQVAHQTWNISMRVVEVW